MRITAALPTAGAIASPATIADAAVSAERRGHESVWVVERLLRPLPRTGRPLVPGYYATVYDPLVVLSWAAARTRRITLGASVFEHCSVRHRFSRASWRRSTSSRVAACGLVSGRVGSRTSTTRPASRCADEAPGSRSTYSCSPPAGDRTRCVLTARTTRFRCRRSVPSHEAYRRTAAHRCHESACRAACGPARAGLQPRAFRRP